ncbi:hypothetical protein BGX34_008897, partial [Mortierella sp. NVP85]
MSVCNYHANGSALDGIMAFFRRIYGQNKRATFLPALYNLTDGPGEFIMKGCTRHVFVPVAVNNHWSVLYLDLIDHEVSFGDPLGEPAPGGTI